MKKWLEIPQAEKKKIDYYYAKRSAYPKRIQRRIERELDALLWLSLNHPSVFLYETNRTDYHQIRLRKLMSVVCALQGKHVEVELTKPIEKTDGRCRGCGLKPNKLNTNNLCHKCNQKQLFESIKAKTHD